MNTFPLHTLETAPAAAQAQLSAVKSRMGFLPNLHLKLAESPVALDAYATLSGIFEKASFPAGERQLILLAAAGPVIVTPLRVSRFQLPAPGVTTMDSPPSRAIATRSSHATVTVAAPPGAVR